MPGRVGEADGEYLTRPHPHAGVHPDAVQQNAVLQPLDPADHRAGQAETAAEQGIYFFARLLRRDGEGEAAGLG